MLRKVLAVLVIVAGGAAIHRFVWLPHQCNVVKGRTQRALDRVWPWRHTYRAQLVAKQNAVQLLNCLERHPHDVALGMATAMNLEVAQRPHLARAVYCDALRFDRRPELYIACGRMQAATGEREAALANFIRAGEFAGVNKLRAIEDIELQWAAIRTVGERVERRLATQGKLDTRNLVLNAAFGEPGARGAHVEIRTPGQVPSAARQWVLVNRGRSVATSHLVESTRRPGAKAIRVNVGAAGSGLRQIVPRANRRPRVRAAAWVRVERGTVCMGASNGRELLTNTCSTKTGVWEKLEAVNDSCPATTFSILATSAGGAEFFVDEAMARLTYAAPPCGP